MKYPLLVVLSNTGILHFHQDINAFGEFKSQKSTVDAWVVNFYQQYEAVDKCHRIFLLYNRVKNIIPATKNNLATGSQVIYVPSHLVADPDILNPQIQFGFVTSVSLTKGMAFCHSSIDLATLRTLSCSELAPISNLFLLNTRYKKDINHWMSMIDRDEKKIRKEYQDPEWIRIRR